MSPVRVTCGLAAGLLALPLLAAEPLSRDTVSQARALRQSALADDTAYELLRSLTTEVGPRPAGSPGDARALAWAVENLKRLGFERVRTEPVTVSHWVRGEARAEIVSPWPQRLVVAALGGSVATPPEGLEADVIPVTKVADLEALPRERVAGRIVFFTNRMERTRSGAGYSAAVDVRSRGAMAAARLGAVAMVMRSSGTSAARTPHTGGQKMADGIPQVPALAMSNPDADLLERELASGRDVRLRLENSSHWDADAESANVIGEIPGSARDGEIVLLGAHLDSWDLGTGAHDDGAGVAIVTAAASLIGKADARPRRTIRVVLYSNEEFGLSGATAYAAAHADELSKHVLGLESDSGAFQPYGLSARVGADQLPLVRAMQAVIEPLGIAYFGTEASGGADLGPLRDAGMPVMDILTDTRPYFDVHHTADDTFDKVDPDLVRLNVAAFAAVAYLAAQAEGGFGRLPVKETNGSTYNRPPAHRSVN
jgi:carboxypeptidase Q